MAGRQLPCTSGVWEEVINQQNVALGERAERCMRIPFAISIHPQGESLNRERKADGGLRR